MGGKAVSSVISIVLLLAVVEATQFSISIPHDNALTFLCHNHDAATCFTNCLKYVLYVFDNGLRVCTKLCNCEQVDTANGSLGSESSIHNSGISEEEARKHHIKGSEIAMASLT